MIGIKLFLNYTTFMMDENTWFQQPSTRPTSVVVVVQSHQSLLIIQRLCEPNIGKWMLPECNVSSYETLKRAAARVVQETAGIIVVRPQLIALFDNPQRNIQRSIAIAFSMKPISTPDSAAPNLHGSKQFAPKWCRICELPMEQMAHDHAKIINSYLAMLRR